ncbi:hypothetical protein HPB50_003107 [Hyalomma asiaticum]|uniref:Uncharacterized protein n=1 Tax=Hyalomma asiaticum TaxID=266040 RepID=A0ACB7TBP4_HYAAI|nr:hypothetical protein HPB50_003107 [Hyalomma asiaticum]
MEDLAPQLGGLLVGDTSNDEPSSRSTLYSAGITVPVTLVVSGGLPDQADMEAHSSTMLSTLTLQTDEGCGPTTQFFLEQLAGGEPLPLQMYLEVGKEAVDENSASMEDVVQTNTGTAVAIVTPDGDESDADELPTPVSSFVFSYLLLITT